MSRINNFLLMCAVIFSLVITYSILKKNSNTENQQEQAAYILIANKPLAVGSKLSANDLEWMRWPSKTPPSKYVLKGTKRIADFENHIVINALNKNEPISENDVIHSDNIGVLSSIIKPGMRAVAIELDASGIMSGLLRPGDHVDVILTHTRGKKRSSNKIYSETLLRKLVVLAVDNAILPKDIDEKSDKKRKKPPKIVTLQVTPKQAEILSVGAKLGTLSLSLISLADDNSNAVSGVTEGSEISQILRLEEKPDTTEKPATSIKPANNKEPKKHTVTIIRGGLAKEVKVD